MRESTAVLPGFKKTHAGGHWVYRCRQCAYVWDASTTLTRDERMWTLAQHLTNAHGRVFPSSVVKA